MARPHASNQASSPADGKSYDRGLKSSGEPRTAHDGAAPADTKKYPGVKAKGQPATGAAGVSPQDQQKDYVHKDFTRSRKA